MVEIPFESSPKKTFRKTKPVTHFPLLGYHNYTISVLKVNGYTASQYQSDLTYLLTFLRRTGNEATNTTEKEFALLRKDLYTIEAAPFLL